MKADPNCPKCKGKGMLPFIKNGKPVPHAFVWCECYREEHVIYHPRPEDFDFPMSDAFRGFTFEYCGLPDPGHVPTSNISELEDRIGNLEEISAMPGRIPRQYYDQFQQIRGEVANLRNKVAEQSAKKRRPTKSSYKGLVIEPEP